MTRADHQRFAPRDRVQPRKVRNGLRLRRKDNFVGAPWPVSSLIAMVDQRCTPQAREEGFVYATAGQVVSILIDAGRIEGLVQGRAAQPYRTILEFRTFTDDSWIRLIESMAAEAVYPARLLAGEVPREIEELATSLGLTMLPSSPDDVSIACTCTEAPVCKHAAAILYHVAERIQLDPRLVFTLRGMQAEHVVMRLQEARSIRTQGVSSAHSLPASARRGQPRPLEECLGEFWRPGPSLEHAVTEDAASFAPHAILRRLGPSPMGGKFPLVGLLASIYDTVREEALRLGGDQRDEDSPPAD